MRIFQQWSSDSEVEILSLDGSDDEARSKVSDYRVSENPKQHPLRDIEEWKARKESQKKAETLEKIYQLRKR